jgi:hypothetical protein
MQLVILIARNLIVIGKRLISKKASQFNWDAFNTQMKPELRYSFRLG